MSRATQRLFIKNPQFAGKIGNMTQLGGDFVFGPGTLHTEHRLSCSGLTNILGPICTFASRMQHAEDREYLGNDGLKFFLTPFVFRCRGFRTDPTLGDRVPTLTLRNANDPLHWREKSQKLF